LSNVASIPFPKPVHVIKRVIALPGDEYRVRVEEIDPLVPLLSILETCGEYYILKLPPSHLFLSADGKGSDSRHWGPIPYNAVIGLVLLRIPRRQKETDN